MAKARVLAKVGVSAREGELVYYKNGVLYAVKAKRGGTKGAKHKCSSSGAAPAKKKSAPARKKATAKKKVATKKKATVRRNPVAKKTAKRRR